MSLDLAALGLRSYEGRDGTQIAGRGSDALGQEQFLTLLVTQLKNQDPLSPMDNEAFVAQLAQFSTVSGITEMNQSLKSMATGAVEQRASAPQWIGRTVTTADGEAKVASVGFEKDGSLILNLDTGKTATLSTVTAIA